jgi:hypothetical protein
MTYSTTGANGTFTPVTLHGSTSGGDVIQGYFGAEQGTTFAPHSTKTYTVRVTLNPKVPVSKTAALLAFEAYLDQISSASGSGVTLADTSATNIDVPSAAGSDDTLRNVLIGAGAALVVALAIGGFLFWRRRHGQPPGPPAAPAAA